MTVPRVSRAPTLEDFLSMKPDPAVAGTLARVDAFVQREPRDGAPPTQRTEAYLGYDDKNLYVIFVAFDSQPGQVRARMARREDFWGDDDVEIMLDTFADRRRAYAFVCNPYGVQWDGLWTEGKDFDEAFDTVWNSRGQPTDQGYVVWIAIPFKSLRFPSTPQQHWNIILLREIMRNNEQDFWPQISSRVEGRLSQAAQLDGLENISPGRNIQLIPYGSFRSYRAPDFRDPAAPRFQRDTADPDGGLDAKLVFHDSLVLDLTANPDFSQVESDEPQVTVDQRFEVFFPEKRPFFLENASFFQTPFDLVFTRRIGDPRLGARLTGKLGPYALGAFVIDDESPGKEVPPANPLAGKRALFTILRLNRDVGRQSTLGVLYTDREFEGSYNRVGGLDGRFKLGQNWVAEFQGVASSTHFLDGSGLAGPAYVGGLMRSGRQLNYELWYEDLSPGFVSEPGFIERTDIRHLGQEFVYDFRPEGKTLIAWGPYSNTDIVYDHNGTRLDLTQDTEVRWVLTRQTEIDVYYNWDWERLRPVDFPVLTQDRDYHRNRKGISWSTSWLRALTVTGYYAWGTRINIVPPVGQEPVLANLRQGNLGFTLRPLTSLRIDTTYIYFRLGDRATDANALTNHILRTKWNYQFTRALSLRVILQYDALLTNPDYTALPTSKNVNADFLLTYLVNPWTALYVGFNTNAQNLAPDLFLCQGPGVARAGCPDLTAGASALLRPRDRFINDAKQFFVKFSYLIRF